jgi:hypothetical protein
MRPRAFRSGFGVALLVLALIPFTASAFPIIQTGVSESAGGDVAFTWYHSGGAYAGYEWAGFDVWRRALDDCSHWERVTAQPYPINSGTPIPDGYNTYQYQHTDHPPAGHSYEYRLRFVDANRNEVPRGPCDCSISSYVSTPQFTTPIYHGRLRDHGWAAYVDPCVESCGPPGYISPIPEALVPYLDTDTALNIYGRAGCGSLEGCSISVDHFEVVVCDDIVPARRTSWGQVKTIYR